MFWAGATMDGWSCGAGTITVDDDGPADYNTIQEAIDNSFDTDIIIVEPGVYRERINFYGKAITVTSTDPCNINVVYSTTIDGEEIGYAVTFDSGEGSDSRLVGMSIQRGLTYNIYCYYSDPLISRCVIRLSTQYGIYGDNASPIIADCDVRENANTGIYGCDGDIVGCNVYDNGNSGMTYCDGAITNCTISNNGSTGISMCEGGTISNCVITGNMWNGIGACASSYISNCTIAGNKRVGIENCDNGSQINCIVTNNGTYGMASSNSNLKYNNVWGNISGNYNGMAPGPTDTHENPRFAIDGYWDGGSNWVEGEYHLQSVAGRWDPCTLSWVNDAVTSLCVDAGDPIGGFLYEPAPNGARINQGAYGGTIEASMSPWGPDPYCGQHIPGDSNNDCRMDMLDFANLATRWLECNLVPASACVE